MYLAASSLGPLSPDLSELIIGTIAFLIVFAVLYRVLFPRIQQTLTERTDAIEGGLKRAEEAQAEAWPRRTTRSRPTGPRRSRHSGPRWDRSRSNWPAG